MVLKFTPKTVSERARFTIRVAEAIRRTGYRFDSSWRHADADSEDRAERLKAAFYARCCTFAANDMADDVEAVRVWRKAP